MVVAAAAGLAASVLAILRTAGDLAVFFGAFAVFVAAGWPLARWYMGDQASAWARAIVAIFLGYLAGALVYMALRAAHIAAPGMVLLACGALAGLLTWTVGRHNRAGLIDVAGLDRHDATAVAGLILLVVLLVGPVFANVGRQTHAGAAYRAYFIADLFAHMSVTAELAKGVTPPVNPYLPSEALPYYWGYFTFPALFSALRPALLPDRGILLTDLILAAVCVSLWYIATRLLGASRLAAAVAWVVVIVATSFEGAFLVVREWLLGRGLWEFRNWNVDAVTRWAWDLPPFDGLHRIMWYTPQHEMAVTMGVLVLATMVRARDADSSARGLADGVLLGSAWAFSSFNALLLIAWYGLVELLVLVRRWPVRVLSWLRARALAAAIVLVFVGLTLALQMVPRSAGDVLLQVNRHFLKGPWAFIALSFGPALLFAPLGLWATFHRRPPVALSLAILTLVCTDVFLFVEVQGHENTYVPFRAGHLFYIVLAFLLAAAIDAWRGWPRTARRIAWAILLVGTLAGLPTAALDWYNARDITNVMISPGLFPWTVHISADDLQAAHWIDAELPADAIVQTDASARGRATWAFIPAFARRRERSGLGLFEPNPRRFDKDIERIRIIFRTGDLDLAYGYCQRMGIQYLYVGAAERAANGSAAVDKFQSDYKRFEMAFRLGSVTIYKVLT